MGTVKTSVQNIMLSFERFIEAYQHTITQIGTMIHYPVAGKIATSSFLAPREKVEVVPISVLSDWPSSWYSVPVGSRVFDEA